MSKDIWHKPNEEMKQVAGLAILVLENGDLNTMWMYPSQKCPEFVYGTEFLSPDDKPIEVEKWCWAAELISTLSATRKALDVAVDALKSVKRYLCEMPAPDGATATRMACESATTVKKALEQITTLKQKDKR